MASVKEERLVGSNKDLAQTISLDMYICRFASVAAAICFVLFVCLLSSTRAATTGISILGLFSLIGVGIAWITGNNAFGNFQILRQNLDLK